MKSRFQHGLYRSSNADLQAQFDEDDDVGLINHFERYGQREMRGLDVAAYTRVEGVVASDGGQLLIVGWADRRMVLDFSLKIDIGFVRHEFDESDLLWFERDDVNSVVGDTEAPTGFIGLLTLDDPVLHGHLKVSICGVTCFEETSLYFLSSDRFFVEALNALAVLADRPIGQSLDQGRYLFEAFQPLWDAVRTEKPFTPVFENQQDKHVSRSIVIVLHGRFDMLIAQLTLLSDYLQTTDTEVVIVCNAVSDVGSLLSQLDAFTFLSDISLRVFLSSGNAGFSAANNFGAKVARGATLIFMNPDIFPPDSMEAGCWRFFDEDPGAALVGALLYYGDGMLMHSGMYVAADTVFDPVKAETSKALRVEHFGKGLLHRYDEDVPDQVKESSQFSSLLATAALFKIRKSVFEKAGGFDESYLFAYYEDADFCLSLLEKKVPIQIDLESKFVHLEGVGNVKSPFLRSAIWMNRCYFTDKFANSPHVAPVELDRNAL